MYQVVNSHRPALSTRQRVMIMSYLSLVSKNRALHFIQTDLIILIFIAGGGDSKNYITFFCIFLLYSQVKSLAFACIGNNRYTTV